MVGHGVYLDSTRHRHQSVLWAGVSRHGASHAGVSTQNKVHRLSTSTSRLVISHANLITGAVSRQCQRLAGSGDVSLVRLSLRLEGNVSSQKLGCV